MAEGPLVPKAPELPPGGVWCGHVFVQDMCNMRCIAVSVSGAVETVAVVSTVGFVNNVNSLKKKNISI